MNAVISPLVSEFETQSKEASYSAWLNEKLERARNSKKPLIAHDQVMAQARTVIELKRKKHAVG
jgi:hypothetical protein